MTTKAILPTRNPSAGFWAASQRNGYDTERVWAAASVALANIFGLSPPVVRNLLDGEAGRVLADDLSFIAEGPINFEAIETLLAARLTHLGWQRFYERAIMSARKRD